MSVILSGPPVLHSGEDVSKGVRRDRRAKRSKTKGKTAQRPESFLWVMDVRRTYTVPVLYGITGITDCMDHFY